MSRCHAFSRNNHFVHQIPQSNRLSKHNNEHRYKQMNVNAGNEHFMQFLLITRTQFEGKKAQGGGSHTIIDETKQNDHTTNNIIDTIILHSQGL